MSITTVLGGLNKGDEDIVRKVTLSSQDDFHFQLKSVDARGVYTAADTTLITKFDQLEADEVYFLCSPMFNVIQQDKRWRQLEDKALEDEVNECLSGNGWTPQDFLRKVRICGDGPGVVWQEWDGVMANGKSLLLIETKRAGNSDHLKNLICRRDAFLAKLSNQMLVDFHQFKPENVSVAMGASHFPSSIRNECLKAGISVVYPSGHRMRMIPA